MDHNDAIRLEAGSRYLAGKLSSEEAQAFEEHFFDCSICAEDLKTDSVFNPNLKAVFQEEALHPPGSRLALVDRFQAKPPGWFDYAKAGWALPLSLAACLVLAVIAYRDAVTIRGLRSEVADLQQPQSVAMVALKLARGAAPQPIPRTRYWVPYFYLPDASANSYVCDIETKAGNKIKSVTMNKPALGQPFSMFLSRAEFPGGTYVFKIRAQNAQTNLATYVTDLPNN